MKRSILILSASLALFSCKKEKTNDLTPTDVTGTSMVKGNVSKNIITPNGSGGYINTTRIPAANVNVSIKIDKSSLYPNSTAQGADVYTGTSDANGNYAIQVKSNATGVVAMITIDGFNGTLDTIVNGATRTGLYSTYAGTTITRTVYMGQNIQVDHMFTGSNVTTNPNTVLKIGNATVTGSVGVSLFRQVMTGTLVTLTTTNVPLPNQKVYLNLSNDPTTLATRLYETTTDGAGYYSFNVTTVAPGTAGFSQTAVLWVSDYAATRDTITTTNTIKAGRAGVFSMQSTTVTGVYNSSIKNANHFIYNVFTPN
jgi:hypothetical protein